MKSLAIFHVVRPKLTENAAVERAEAVRGHFPEELVWGGGEGGKGGVKTIAIRRENALLSNSRNATTAHQQSAAW